MTSPLSAIYKARRRTKLLPAEQLLIQQHTAIPYDACTAPLISETMETGLQFFAEDPAGATVTPASVSMESFPWPVVRIDNQLRCLNGNSAMASLTGSKLSVIEGHSLAHIGWPTQACEEVARAVSYMKSDPIAQHIQLKWQTDNEEFHFDTDLLPERDEQGLPASVLILLRASPANRQSQNGGHIAKTTQAIQARQVPYSRKKTQAAYEARDAFFGWMSHELRTPLNGIQSWTHILETYATLSSNSALAARAMQGIRKGIAQQLRLIEDLLDANRIIEGKLAVSFHVFALRPVVHSVLDSVRVTAVSRQVEFKVHHELEQDLLTNDPCRIQQCMTLLLSHSINRAMPHSTLKIRLCEEDGNAVFCVQHRCGKGGKAIPPSSEVHLPSSPSRESPRKEMELLLARCLAELLNGRLTTVPGDKEGETKYRLIFPLHKECL